MAEYIQVQKDIFIVGIGLHKSFSEEFIAGNDKNIARDISDKSFEKFQLTRNVLFGLNKMIRQKGTLEDGGHILGYELVTYVVGFICSYLCTCDQFDMIEKFNTYPNSYGLIDRFDIATEVRKWRGSDDNYFPWLIVQYPIP